MKREIKFRAWDIKNKEIRRGGFGMSTEGDFWQYADQGYLVNSDLNEEFVLMQFTGLYDKNGKEIYESDWVKDSIGSMGVVEYSNDKMMFQFQIKKYENQGAWQHPVNSGFDSETLEVIGNIYEGRQEK